MSCDKPNLCGINFLNEKLNRIKKIKLLYKILFMVEIVCLSLSVTIFGRCNLYDLNDIQLSICISLFIGFISILTWIIISTAVNIEKILLTEKYLNKLIECIIR